MEITCSSSFVAYYEKTRIITNKVIAVIPPDKIEWTYLPGKFTIGDVVRHIAAIERYVFAEVAMGRKPKYKGCGQELAAGYAQVADYFNTMHNESMDLFATIPDENLKRNVWTLDGKEIELGNFLRALVVHEVHHRGALCIYLNLLGVATPPIIGLTEKDVIRLSTADAE